MSYRRFVTEAEPTKPTTCSNCGALLKRSSTVWLLVAVMSILMLSMGYPLFTALHEDGYSASILIVSVIIWLSMWVALVNLLSWKLIKWQPVDPVKLP